MFSTEFTSSLADAIAAKVIEQMSEQGVVPKRLLTLDEAAKYLGRTQKAVEHLIARGTLPVTRLDGKRQVDREELDKLISSRTFYED